jgi:hypothetical protein
MIRYPYTDGVDTYLPIPKCGTTSMKQTFPDWEKMLVLPTRRLPAFTFVRHPVARWFSAVNEYAINNRLNYDMVVAVAEQTEYAINNRFNYDMVVAVAEQTGRFAFDQHTAPQADYLYDVFDVELVRLENAGDYVWERFGRELWRLRQREWTVLHRLIPYIEAGSCGVCVSVSGRFFTG